MTEIHNPHDVFFKNTMSDKDNAISFLQNYLPVELLRLIDLDSLQIEKDSFVSDKLQQSFSDLLYQVKLPEPRAIFICCSNTRAIRKK